jgi:8-oxo-dGTP pyrophosphatase MutT (NUDIX family)
LQNDLRKFWRQLLDNLPLTAAEGNEYIAAEFPDLLRTLGDEPDNRAALSIVQEIFVKTGVLDARCLDKGEWRFVSYPARLFACSLLSLMTNEGGFFPRDFWSADKNSDASGQSNVLHALETLRYDTAEKSPIRRTHVAWGLIKRAGQFVLKRRENRDDDPDNAMHGGYVFPGGRLNMSDMDDPDNNLQDNGKLALLYGLPKQLTKEEERALNAALERTLVRELREELGLIQTTHYKFSVSPVQSPPRTFVHGANGQHCITESRITFYEVYLTPAGDAFLALKCADHELFTIQEMTVPPPDGRKVFYDFSNKAIVDHLDDLADSASHLRAKRSELSRAGRKSKNADATAVILPVEPQQPLLLGGVEITLDKPEYVDLLLLLGLNARFGLQLKLLSDVIKRKRWGWLELDPKLCEIAYSLNRACDDVSPILLEASMCRLNCDREEIFFHSDLFKAELKSDELVIARDPLLKKGLFQLDADSSPASLTQFNVEHLRNLLCGKSDLGTYDHLRKLRTRGNQTLDEFARQFGLYRLYEPIDDTVGNEFRLFRFSIRVNDNRENAKSCNS